MFAAALACSPEEVTPGQLVVSVETDMALPEQVDTLRVEVLVRGALHFGNDYEVGENGLLMPATLTLVAGEDPATPVTVRVIGMKGPRPRTLRETTTTVPRDRVASLPMPVQWLCDDTVTPGDDGELSSTCGEGNTCSGGRCIAAELPEPELPTYAPEQVFGGATTPEEGTCFDTLGCMESSAVAEPDADCTIAKPGGGLGVNVALRVLNDGICDAAGSACFVPLHADSDDGFRERDGRLVLPGSVCERLRAGRVSAVVVSTLCATRPASSPACGSWSSVRVLPPPPPVEEKPPPPPSVSSEVAANGGSVCCPLLADSERFYSCLCSTASTRVDLVAIERAGGTPTRVASFTPLIGRDWYATALIDDLIYWVDREATGDIQDNALVQETSLSSGETRLVARFAGDVFDDGMLLADSTTLYAMASLVGDEGEDAQVVAVDRESGETRFFSAGAAWVGYDFAQDEDSLYITASSDLEAARSSRIERVSKLDGTRETLSEIEVGVGDENSGFSGLTFDGGKLFVISMDPQGDGSVQANLLAVDLEGKREVLYTQPLEARRARLRPLGVSDGVVMLGRWQLADAASDAVSESASLLLVPGGGKLPRVLAEFLRDAPVGQLQTPPFDRDAVYWLNASGKVYRLSREALVF